MEKAEQPQEKRRSPAEAFDELKAAVNRSSAEISDLWDFSQKVKDKLFKSAEMHRLEGLLPLLDSMVQIHHILFQRVAAGADKKQKKKDKSDDKFIASLLETIEEEMSRHSVIVVKPELGSSFDVHTMECTSAVKKNDKKDEPNTIAAVNRCGFLYKLASEKNPRLVAKAQVEVFAK